MNDNSKDTTSSLGFKLRQNSCNVLRIIYNAARQMCCVLMMMSQAVKAFIQNVFYCLPFLLLASLLYATMLEELACAQLCKSLQEMRDDTIHVPDVTIPIDMKNDGRLVHMIGMVEGHNALHDDEFNIHLYRNNSDHTNISHLLPTLKLRRIVEKYPLDDPVSFQFDDKEMISTNVTLGSYIIASNSQIKNQIIMDQINWYVPLNL